MKKYSTLFLFIVTIFLEFYIMYYFDELFFKYFILVPIFFGVLKIFHFIYIFRLIKKLLKIKYERSLYISAFFVVAYIIFSLSFNMEIFKFEICKEDRMEIVSNIVENRPYLDNSKGNYNHQDIKIYKNNKDGIIVGFYSVEGFLDSGFVMHVYSSKDDIQFVKDGIRQSILERYKDVGISRIDANWYRISVASE